MSNTSMQSEYTKHILIQTDGIGKHKSYDWIPESGNHKVLGANKCETYVLILAAID